jgi:hypothetical protein
VVFALTPAADRHIDSAENGVPGAQTSRRCVETYLIIGNTQDDGGEYHMRIPSWLVTKTVLLLTTPLYAGIVFFAVVLLALVQLRSKGGEAFDTWKLSYDAVTEQENLLKSTRDKQEEDQNALLSYKDCLLRFYNNKSGDLLQNAHIDQQTKQEAAKAIREHTVYQLQGDPYCVARGFSGLQLDRDYREQQVRLDSGRIDNLQKSLAALHEQTKGHEDFVALAILEGKHWYYKPFIDSPYDLVVLVLVMTMGAIGGIMRIFRDYFRPHHPNPDLKDYALIPSIGAVVAIGGYVLAKTGLLLLSSSSGETPLSPYMVSFVGILSGLLAKEVIEAIAAAGRKVLQRSAEPPSGAPVKAEVGGKTPGPEKGRSGHEAAAA